MRHNVTADKEKGCTGDERRFLATLHQHGVSAYFSEIFII